MHKSISQKSKYVLLEDRKVEAACKLAEIDEQSGSKMTLGDISDSINEIAGPCAEKAEVDLLLAVFCFQRGLEGGPPAFGENTEASIREQLGDGSKYTDIIVPYDECNPKKWTFGNSLKNLFRKKVTPK